MQDLARRFESEPSLAELRELSRRFTRSPQFAQPSAATLEVYAAILQSRVVGAFADDAQGLAALAAAFRSPAGLGCLTSRLRDAPGSEVGALLRLLGAVLEQARLADLLESAYAETSQLVWGSRILGQASARGGSHPWLGDLPRYADWLARRMVAEQLAEPRLFDRGVKLGAPRAFLAPFLVDRAYLRALYRELRPAQQEFVLSHGVLPLLGAPGPGAQLLLDLAADPGLLARLCWKLPATVDQIRAVIVVARETGRLAALAGQLVQDWASPAVIARCTLLNQQALTQLLIGASASLTGAEAARIAHSPEFTAGVSRRLQSTAAGVRELGPLVAEVYAKRGGAQLEFGLRYTGYPWWIGRDELAAAPRDEDAADAAAEEASQAALRSVVAPGADSDDEATGRDFADADSDDADSEDEADPPYYVKDLVAYLRSDKYAEVAAALEHGARLVLRKAAFGSEVPQHAEALLQAAAGLTDKHSLTKFGERRQAILNAVLVADPQQAPVLARLLVTGDWSLAQRQSLLAAVAHAAHHLAQGDEAAPHEMLPQRLHQLFVSEGERFASEEIGSMHIGSEGARAGENSAINGSALWEEKSTTNGKLIGDNSLSGEKPLSGETSLRGEEPLNDSKSLSGEKWQSGEKSLTDEISATNRNSLSGEISLPERPSDATVVRRSARLSTARPLKKNNFSAVSNLFFFPLLAAQPPLRRSSYDAIVYSQWLRTLGLIVAEAYPTSHMPEMVTEMWALLSSLAKQSALHIHEPVVLEALYASLSMVISVGAGIIVQRFPSEVGTVFDQVVAGLEGLSAAGPRAVVAGRAAAAQLARLMQQINNRILGDQA